MMSSKQVAANVKVLQTVKAHTSDVTCLEFWSNQLFTGSGLVSQCDAIVIVIWATCNGYQLQ